MAKIPESFITELKATTDLVKFASQFTALKKVGNGIWQGPCPHPDHNDSTPSFTVWEKHNSWSCYGCHSGKKGLDNNVGSDIYAFVQWVTKNNDFRNAVKVVADWNGVAIPTDENQKEYDRNYKLAMKYKKNLLEQEEHVIEYLYERGFDDSDIDKWIIGFDKTSKRIVFPLIDRYNNIIGFNKRTIEKHYELGDKYKNSPNSKIFNKSTYLYGIHDLDNDFNEIRITEGSIDVALAKKYGVKNIVASLGTSFTESHAKVISKLNKIPVLIFDGDEAGESGLYKALAYFEALGVYCKIVRLPKGKDLADMAQELKFNLESYIKQKSITAGYLKIKNVVDEYNSSLYELKLETLPKLEAILQVVPLSEKKAIKTFVKDELNITIE